MLWGDVHSAAPNFKPLYDFLARDVVFARDRAHLATLPAQSWMGLLSVVAAFLPFYYPAEVRPTAACAQTAGVAQEAVRVIIP